MLKSLGVLTVHGMGRQEEGFSDKLRRELERRLGDRSERVALGEVFWADALEERERELWECMKQAGHENGADLHWKFLRQFIVHNFGDALAYHRDRSSTSAYQLINGILGDSLDALRAELAPGAPIAIIAHSLGAHMVSNYIWDGQAGSTPSRADDIVSLVTFGCNIALFSLAFEKSEPIVLPGSAITKEALRAASRWLNYFDRDDVLGWPVRPIYEKNRDDLSDRQRATVDRIEDREINVGTPLVQSATPWSHAGYWTDNDFTKPVAAHLIELIEAIDK